MELLCVICVVGFAVLCIVSAMSISGDESREEEQRDPCRTCNRWWECNGVDVDICPLWESVNE